MRPFEARPTKALFLPFFFSKLITQLFTQRGRGEQVIRQVLKGGLKPRKSFFSAPSIKREGEGYWAKNLQLASFLWHI
jgi:hypothetical protein